MKRLLAVLLIMCMAVSVCAFGKKEYYKVGEKISTNRAELKLISADFCENIKSSWAAGTLAGTSERDAQGNIEKNIVLLAIEFDVKNVGKKEITKGYLTQDVELVFDGKVYDAKGIEDTIAKGCGWDIPVGEKHLCRAYYVLPRDAFNNSDKELYINFTLPKSKDKVETFKYDLRK